VAGVLPTQWVPQTLGRWCVINALHSASCASTNSNSHMPCECHSSMPNCSCTQPALPNDAPGQHSDLRKSCESRQPGSMVCCQCPHRTAIAPEQQIIHVVGRPPVLTRMQLHPTARSRCMRLACAVGKTHRGCWWLGCGVLKRPEVPHTAIITRRVNVIVACQTAHANNRLCQMMRLTTTATCASHVRAGGMSPWCAVNALHRAANCASTHSCCLNAKCACGTATAPK
jgi:hypothetical protein